MIGEGRILRDGIRVDSTTTDAPPIQLRLSDFATIVRARAWQPGGDALKILKFQVHFATPSRIVAGPTRRLVFMPRSADQFTEQVFVVSSEATHILAEANDFPLAAAPLNTGHAYGEFEADLHFQAPPTLSLRLPELPETAAPLQWLATLSLRKSAANSEGASESFGLNGLSPFDPLTLQSGSPTKVTGTPGSLQTVPLRSTGEYDLELHLTRRDSPIGLGPGRHVRVPLEDAIVITPSDKGGTLEPQVEASALEAALRELRK